LLNCAVIISLAHVVVYIVEQDSHRRYLLFRSLQR